MKELGFIDFSAITKELLSTENITSAAGSVLGKEDPPKNPCEPSPLVRALISTTLGAASFFTGLPLSLVEFGLAPLFQCEEGKRILVNNLKDCLRAVGGPALYPLLIGTSDDYNDELYYSFYQRNYPWWPSIQIIPSYKFKSPEADAIIHGFSRLAVELMSGGWPLAKIISFQLPLHMILQVGVNQIDNYFEQAINQTKNTNLSIQNSINQYGADVVRQNLGYNSKYYNENEIWNDLKQRGLEKFFTPLYELMKKCLTQTTIDSARVNNPKGFEIYKNQIPQQPNPRYVGLDSGVVGGAKKSLLPLIIATGGLATLGVALSRRKR